MFQKIATPFGVAIFTGTAGNLIAHAEWMHEKERGAWCEMKEYKEAEKQVEKIKESEDVGELERFF